MTDTEVLDEISQFIRSLIKYGEVELGPTPDEFDSEAQQVVGGIGSLKAVENMIKILRRKH